MAGLNPGLSREGTQKNEVGTSGHSAMATIFGLIPNKFYTTSVRRGRVGEAFALHFSCTHARSLGLNLTTAIGPATARTRLTQPATFSGMANRIPASAGVMAGTSPMSDDR